MKAKDLKGRAPNILIYGPVGTQKTALVSQAKNGYLFDFDNGMMIALMLDDKFKELRHSIEFDTYCDENPMHPKAWIDARKKMADIVRQVQSKTWKYDSIIIDSLTGMAKAIQLHVLNCTGDSFKHPKIQDWGAMVTELERALTLMRACNVLRIVTAHQMPIETVKENAIFPTLDHITPLSITRPHSESKLSWLFDEVWYSSVKAGARGVTNFIVDGRTNNTTRSKTRGGLLEAVVHNDIGLAGVLEKIGYKYGK